MNNNGSKQKNIRIYNIKNILNLLYKRKLSLSEIAKATKLSKQAVINILTEMLEKKFIKNTLGENGKKWQRTLYEIADDAGFFCITDFGSTFIRIIFSNFNGDILFEKRFDDEEFITLESLEIVIEEINKNKKIFESKNYAMLLNIISTPGKINRIDEEIYYSKKFEKVSNIKIKEKFSKEIGVKTILKNDINLSVLGEKEASENENIEDLVVIYIDSGIGGAILNKSSVIEGKNGYAAEFGLISTILDGKSVKYDRICSINSIKKSILERIRNKEESILGEKFRFKDVVDAFYKQDNLVLDAVYKTTNKISLLINNLANILDINSFIISGRITHLGEKYLNWVKEGIVDDNIEIKLSTLNQDAPVLGAIRLAVKCGFEILSKMESN